MKTHKKVYYTFALKFTKEFETFTPTLLENLTSKTYWTYKIYFIGVTSNIYIDKLKNIIGDIVNI